MMTAMMGGKAKAGKMKGIAGGVEGAMSAMAAEEKLVNPHTVSDRLRRNSSVR